MARYFENDESLDIPGSQATQTEPQKQSTSKPNVSLLFRALANLAARRGVSPQISSETKPLENVTPEEPKMINQQSDIKPLPKQEPIDFSLDVQTGQFGDQFDAPFKNRNLRLNEFLQNKSRIGEISTQLSDKEEKDFEKWYSEIASKTGLNPNPDDPRHYYDYRAAFKAGAMPDESGHWPSKFKTSDHPNRFVNGVDTITGETVQPVPISTHEDGIIPNLWNDVMRGLAQLNAGITRIPATLYDVMNIPQNKIMKMMGMPDKQVKSPEWFLNNPFAKYYDNQAKIYARLSPSDKFEDAVASKSPARIARHIARQVVINAPQQVATLAFAISGIPEVGLAFMGGISGSEANREARERGIDPEVAASNALVNGVIEAGFENLGTMGLFKKWENILAKDFAKKSIKNIFSDSVKAIFYSAFGEGNEEFWTSLAQDFSAFATGADPKALEGMLPRAIEAASVGAASGGAMTAPSAIATAAGPAIKEANVNLGEKGSALIPIPDNEIKRFVRLNKESIKDSYREKYGNVISKDRIKDFFRPVGYNGSNEDLYKDHVQKIANELFDEVIKENKGTGKEFIWTTGGTGSGKSTLINSLGKENVAGIYDLNLQDFETSKKAIQKVIDNGLVPNVIYVLRDPHIAFVHGVLKRALDKNSLDYERIVTIYNHLKVHETSKEVFPKLVEHFGDKLRYTIVDNRGSVGETKYLTLDELKKIKYDYQGVGKELEDVLSKAKSIPENLRTSFLEKRPKSTSGTSPESSNQDAREGIQSERGTPPERQIAFQKEKLKQFPKLEKAISVKSAEESLKQIKEARKEYGFPDLTQEEEYQIKFGGLSPNEKIDLYLSGAPTETVQNIVKESTGQKDASKTIELSEKEALKEQLKSKAQAARYGYRAGRSDARRVFIDKFSEKQGDIKARKQALSEYIDENAPANFKKILKNQFKDATTDNQLIRAFARADDMIEKIDRRLVLGEIKSLFDKSESTKKIAVEYRGMIQAIEDEINFNNQRQDTVNRIRKTKVWLDKQISAGKDVTIPKRIYEAVRGLEKTSVHDLGLNDLYILYDTIDTLASLGEQRQINRQSAFIAEQSRIKNELLNAPTQKVEARKLIEKIENLTPKENATNLFRTSMNKLQALDLNISPMDAIFDMFDKGAGYVGPWYRNFKRRVDIDFGNFLQEIWSVKDDTAKYVNALKLNEENFRRIGVYAAKVQEGGREKLHNNGLTDAQIDGVKLTKNENDFYQYMRGNMDKLLPRIKEMMATVYNEDVGEVENYFSFMTDFDALNELEVAQRVFDDEGRRRLQSKPNIGFTQSRIGTGQQKIKINAFDIYLNHMENALYAVNMAYTNKLLAGAINTPEIEANLGLRGKTIIKQWLDVVNKKGGASGQQYIKGLDVLRHNLGVAMLGLKLSSAMVQPTALLDGAAIIGDYAFRGAGKIASSSQWRQFVSQFPEIKDRVGDDPAFSETSRFKPLESVTEKVYSKISGKPKPNLDFQKIGMAPLRYLDGKTAASIAAGAYMKYLKDNKIKLDFDNINQNALQYAQGIVRRTQASSSFKDSPLIISRGKLGERFENRSLARAITQFNSFMLSRWARYRYDFPNQIKNKQYKEAAQNVFYLMSALGAETLIRNISKEMLRSLFGGEKKDEDFWKEYLINAMQTVPFISNAVSMFYYNSIPVPLIDYWKKLSTDLDYLKRSKRPQAKAKWAKILAVESLGGFMGLPGAFQLSQILRKEKIRKAGYFD